MDTRQDTPVELTGYRRTPAGAVRPYSALAAAIEPASNFGFPQIEPCCSSMVQICSTREGTLVPTNGWLRPGDEGHDDGDDQRRAGSGHRE